MARNLKQEITRILGKQYGPNSKELTEDILKILNSSLGKDGLYKEYNGNVTGFSASPAPVVSTKYTRVGDSVHVVVEAWGISNGDTVGFDLPFSPADFGQSNEIAIMKFGFESGSFIVTENASIFAGETTFDSSRQWTETGLKGFKYDFWYTAVPEIAASDYVVTDIDGTSFDIMQNTEVPQGTTINDLSLATTIDSIELASGDSVDDAAIEWDSNGYDPDTLGVYTIYARPVTFGVLSNPNDIKYALVLEVVAVP